MAKALSLNDIRSRCAELVVRWLDQPGDERQQAQTFVRDLLTAFGITDSMAGKYEKRAKRASTGGRGYIDALVPGMCLVEMKSKGKDLERAEAQALDYMDDLTEAEQPRWIITSDFFNFRVLDLHADEGSDLETFTLEELPAHVEALAFLAGYQTVRFGNTQQERASVKAAQLMASLYESLGGSGYDDHEASVFLVRTLFCLYADDSGVWERDLLFEFIENRTNADGSDLGPQLAMLYQTLNRPLDKRQALNDELLMRFPYVNGGIFAENLLIPSFNREMREKLLEACAFNWSAISPAVFGSLFQSVKDAKARRSLGEHYTTETNILKTINPLLMDELRARFAEQSHSVQGLRKLRKDLGKLRVMDPACGCGNFLVVAYRELRRLDLDILTRLQELGDSSEIPTMFFTKENLPVTLDHFAGIEIEEWPARIASTALHLAEHQANQALELSLGMAPDPLPLDTLDVIHVGNALQTEWERVTAPSADVLIVGNPPFIGQFTKTANQTDDLKCVWGKHYDGYLDYVTGWYKKASDYYRQCPGGRFAFVSTNSITQGQPVPALFGPLFDAGWRIRFAHRTFPWVSEAPGAAAVHCVIVGFDKAKKPAPRLFTYPDPKGVPVEVPAANINGYLINGPSIFVEKRSAPLNQELPRVRFGSKPVDGGFLILDDDAYAVAMMDPHAAKYVRPYRMGRELIHSIPRWCLWMQELDPADVGASDFLKTRLNGVRQFRAASKKAATRKLADTPAVFAEDHQPKGRYLGLPRVFSETRMWATCDWLSPEVIAADSVFTCDDPEGFAFAIASSSVFITWQRMVGGRMKSDLRFSNTVVWNNLPLPDVDAATRQAIIDAGQGVLDARALHPERSLADHYNPLAMDPALIKAHRALDRVVDKAFGATKPLETNDERQTLMFEMFRRLTQRLRGTL